MPRLRLFLIPAAAALLMLLAWWLWPSSTRLDSRYLEFDQRFSPYIAAYTHGEISRNSPIRVRFAEDVAPAELIGKTLDDSPLRFSPSIDGTATWEDARTLRFSPDSPLPSGEAFEAEVVLEEWFDNLPRDLREFPFSFGTPAQQFRVELVSQETFGKGEKSWQRVSGVVKMTDWEDPAKVEEMLRAELPGKGGIFRWDHQTDDKTFAFVVDSLPRLDQDYSFALRWTGKPIDMDLRGEETITVPAKGVFRHLHTYSYGKPEPYVVLEFSEPVGRQELRGLIQLEGHNGELRFTTEGNRIKVFPSDRLNGTHTLLIHAGIESGEGAVFARELRELVTFSEILPEIRLIGDGVILPNTDKLPFIFESIGLKAIDVRVIKIFEKNIPQFLQVNRLNDHQQLKRVGQPVVQKRIDLNRNPDLDLNTWTRHSLDLGELIHPDPGAIYEVSIGFRKSYAYFPCSAEEDADAERSMLELDDNWYVYNQDSEYSYWDYWYGDYDDRDNPCKSSYYHSERIVRRNVLASDLGLLAKRDDKDLFVSVTHLQTTAPIAGVELEWYDYQNQLMYTGKTDKDGWAKIPMTKNHPPFLLIAKQGNQRGYLRMDDGSSLSLSRFDIQGETYTQGVKGFLYGERGVWRPGDPMYLTFILQDEAKVLPANHPVTMELIDPRGQQVVRMVKTEGERGFYHFLTQTNPSAPTGNYLARVRVGGSVFEKRLKVETVIPNRLKLALDFATQRLSASASPSGTLSARWLHGAIARNLQADVSVTLRPGTTAFPRYSDFTFRDPINEFRSEEAQIFEGKLDETGKTTVSPKIKIEGDAPGMLDASFVAKVYEPGGAFSVDRFTVPYSPYPVYTGIKTPNGDVARGMLLTDTNHPIEIVTLNEAGNPVNSVVEVTLYKLDWRWWWDQSTENVGIYNGRVSAEEITTAKVSTVNGKATWQLNVAYPQWGRFLIRAKDDQGHATGKIVYIDWPGWAGRAKEGQEGGAAMLDFSSDKEKYAVGDSITLNIPTGDAGKALVSIEAGNDVLKTYWVQAAKGTTRFRFLATPEMAPNVYAHVTLLQPHAQTANDLPIRLYGIVPIQVENPQTHLAPNISLPASIRPDTDFTVKVSETNGRAMTYTVAIVDEGLLGLTRFQTPAPWEEFYRREALTIQTWDIFDQVLGAYGGEIKSLLSIGGDGDLGPPPGQKAERFKPVVMYLGPFTLQPGETKTHTVHMPNYIGEVRAMIVAGTPEGAYGSAETSVPVKQPLMVLGTLPRVLGPGESLRLPVTLFALEDHVKDVEVEVKTGRRVLVNGSAKEMVKFAQQGEKMTYFDLTVLSSLGVDHLTITAKSGAETAVYETDIEVRASNPRVYNTSSGTLAAGAAWTQPITPNGMRGTNHGVLEVSAIPPLNLGRRLEELIRYPFGCLEQTTSSAFPLVYVPKLMEVNAGQRAAIDDKIRKAIDRIKLFQLSSGGLAYWPGTNDPSHWGTSYAGHFLLEAEKAGYQVPSSLRDNWVRYQRDRAREWARGERSDQLAQGYRLYLLALAGSPELGAMNRFRSFANLDPVAKWYLAGAYQLAGRANVAKEITANLNFDFAAYNELGGTYGSDWRDRAIVLEVLSNMNEKTRAKPLVDLISGRLSENRWMSTQTTAYCLVAMAKFVGTEGNRGELAFSYRLNDGAWVKVNQQGAIWQLDMDDLKAGKVEVKNESRSVIFPRLVVDGIPAVGDTTDASNGLRLDVSYLALNDQPLDPAKLEQGSNFVVQVTVTNTGLRGYEELALTQIFPSGWEILNSRLDNREATGDLPDYQDQRDDRVFTFFDLEPKKSKTFRLYLNASYLGKFYLPTVTVEAMYDQSINARRHGRWVEVINPGAGG